MKSTGAGHIFISTIVHTKREGGEGEGRRERKDSYISEHKISLMERMYMPCTDG
jgi:hypothetical protein